MKKYGVVGCTKAIESKLEQVRKQAEANNILNEPLKEVNLNHGTIQAYIDYINSKINNIKKEHSLTGQIIRERKQSILNDKMQKKQQEELESSIDIILVNISENLEQFTVSSNEIDNYNNFINSNFQQNYLAPLEQKINNIVNTQKRDAYKEKYKGLVSRFNAIASELNTKYINKMSTDKNIISNNLSFIENKYNEIISGKYTEDEYIDLMSDINSKISKCDTILVTLNTSDKIAFENRLLSIKDKIKKNTGEVERALKKASDDQNQVMAIQSKLNDLDITTQDIEFKRIKVLKTNIEYTKKGLDSKLCCIKNTAIREEQRQIVESKIASIRDRINQKENEEKAKISEAIAEAKELIQNINQKASELETMDTKIKSQEHLNELITELNSKDEQYSFKINDLKERLIYTNMSDSAYILKRELEQSLSNFKSKYRKVKTNMEANLSRFNSALTDLDKEINKIKRDINNLDSNSFKTLQNRIEAFNDKIRYSELLGNDIIDSEKRLLLTILNSKAKELNLL